MHVRRQLLTPLAVVLAVVLAVGACADPTTSPSAAPAPKAPALALATGTTTEGVPYVFENFNIFGVTAATDSANGCGRGIATGFQWPCAAPLVWRPEDFDVAIHQRDRAVWNAPEAFRGMHGIYCQPYQAAEPGNAVRPDSLGSHFVTTYNDMNYRCRDHMMTALKSSGYGAIYVTPNAKVDLSGTVTIRFALATLRLQGASGSEDWIDLWITPWRENLVLPLDTDLSDANSPNLTDLQGPPADAVHLRMAGTPTATTFKLSTVAGSQETQVATSDQTLESVVTTPTSTFRDTFELQISRTNVRFGIVKRVSATQQHETVWFLSSAVALGDAFNESVVQFGHHSRRQSLADNAYVGGTWHWDDFSFAPASRVTTFRVYKIRNPGSGVVGNDRFADSKHPDMAVSPANGPVPATGERYLRFAGYGERFQVSFDGSKWADVEPQTARYDYDGRFRSYFVRIPDGVSPSAVSFKAKKDKAATESSNKDSGDWRVRDVAIWVR